MRFYNGVRVCSDYDLLRKNQSECVHIWKRIRIAQVAPCFRCIKCWLHVKGRSGLRPAKGFAEDAMYLFGVIKEGRF